MVPILIADRDHNSRRNPAPAVIWITALCKGPRKGFGLSHR